MVRTPLSLLRRTPPRGGPTVREVSLGRTNESRIVIQQTDGLVALAAQKAPHQARLVIVIDVQPIPLDSTTDRAHPKLSHPQSLEIADPEPVLAKEMALPLLALVFVTALGAAALLRSVHPVFVRLLPPLHSSYFFLAVLGVPLFVRGAVALLAIVTVTVLHVRLSVEIRKWLRDSAFTAGLLRLLGWPESEQGVLHRFH